MIWWFLFVICVIAFAALTILVNDVRKRAVPQTVMVNGATVQVIHRLM